MNSSGTKIFLTAEWRYLAMLNFEVAPEVLSPFVPQGTELDSFHGKTFASVVGFRFLKTCVKGIPVPFHRNFDEVNLRFYVRRKTADGWRRGVVFIKEIVPRCAIAFVARKFFNENYTALPVAHQIELAGGEIKSVQYSWRFNHATNHLKLAVTGKAQALKEGSFEEFIAEHYWGYARQRDGSTLEYQVNHPPWRFWSATQVEFQCDIKGLYGEAFAEPLTRPPTSAFLADGSAVQVHAGTRLI
jgi:uncharacterized protein